MKRLYPCGAALVALGVVSMSAQRACADISSPSSDPDAIVPMSRIAPETVSEYPSPEPLFGGWVLQVGTRSLHKRLLSDRKGEPFHNSFVGSIHRLEADQDYLPFRHYLQIVSPQGLGAGLSFDRMRVATMDYWGGDGDILMRGYYFYMTVLFPNKTRLTPFAELGVAHFKNEFDPFPEWYAGGRREFVLSNSTAPYLGGGGRFSLSDQWAIEVYARYIDVDIDSTYIFRGDNRPPEDFVFTLRHLAYGIGVSASFH